MARDDENQPEIELLTSLFRAEHRAILPLLGRTSPWVSESSLELADLSRSVQKHRTAAIDWLAARIDTLGGTVPPVRWPTAFSEISYLTLEYILPHVLRDQEAIARAYADALGRAPGGDVREGVAGLARESAEDLEKLQTIHARLEQERIEADRRRAEEAAAKRAAEEAAARKAKEEAAAKRAAEAAAKKAAAAKPAADAKPAGDAKPTADASPPATPTAPEAKPEEQGG
ncbi:MAG: hypothetical protein BIFFINMI_00141 [Phycisphaerae bacterium]|nr:hypothetical protein [Phycisphaerae bacterium]